MPAPTSYTETSLAAYMVAELSNVGVVLGWTAATPQIVEAVYEVEFALGVVDIADLMWEDAAHTIPIVDSERIPHARAQARLEAWRAAKKALASQIDTTADGQSFKLSQLYTQASTNVTEAKIELDAFAESADTIIVGSITRDTNPYAPIPLSGIGELG